MRQLQALPLSPSKAVQPAVREAQYLYRSWFEWCIAPRLRCQDVAVDIDSTMINRRDAAVQAQGAILYAVYSRQTVYYVHFLRSVRRHVYCLYHTWTYCCVVRIPDTYHSCYLYDT